MNITNQGISSISFLLTILGIVILTGIQFKLEGFGKGCHRRAKNSRDKKYNQTCTIGDEGNLCGKWDREKRHWHWNNHRHSLNNRHKSYCEYRKRLLEQYVKNIQQWRFPRRGVPRWVIQYRRHYYWYHHKVVYWTNRARAERNYHRRRRAWHIRARMIHGKRNRRAYITRWINNKIRKIRSWPNRNNWWKTTRGWQNRADMHTRRAHHHNDRKDHHNTKMLKYECGWEKNDPSSTKFDTHKCWNETKDGIDKYSKEKCDNFWNMQNNATKLENRNF